MTTPSDWEKPPWADAMSHQTFDYGAEQAIMLRVGQVAQAVRYKSLKCIEEPVYGPRSLALKKVFPFFYWHTPLISAGKYESVEFPFDEACASLKDWFQSRIPIYREFLERATENGWTNESD